LKKRRIKIEISRDQSFTSQDLFPVLDKSLFTSSHALPSGAIELQELQIGNFLKTRKGLVFYRNQRMDLSLKKALMSVIVRAKTPCLNLKLMIDLDCVSVSFAIRNLHHLDVEVDQYRTRALSFSSFQCPELETFQDDISRRALDSITGLVLSDSSGFRLVFREDSNGFFDSLNNFVPGSIQTSFCKTIEVRDSHFLTFDAMITRIGSLKTSLTFSSRYLLHALVAERKLVLDEIESLVSVLSSYLEKLHRDGLYHAFYRYSWKRQAPFNATELLAESFDFYSHEELKAAAEVDDEDDDEDYAYIGLVEITPCQIRPRFPSLVQTNRVIREFWSERERFLSAKFIDEGGQSIAQAASSSPDVARRMTQSLLDGVRVAGRNFRFLSYSNSQMRQHSCWIYSDCIESLTGRKPLSTHDLRTWMGDFSSIKTVSKYGARLGQCFSTTQGTIEIHPSECIIIPDISPKGRPDFCFSDRVGMLSQSLQERICRDLGIKDTSISAFQVRFGGAKGVLTVWPQSAMPGPDYSIALRNSMIKFSSCWIA
jgi:hypothetical protein